MLVSWSGLDIGLDRGSPVTGCRAPFSFTGMLAKMPVTMDFDQMLNSAGVAPASGGQKWRGSKACSTKKIIPIVMILTAGLGRQLRLTEG